MQQEGEEAKVGAEHPSTVKSASLKKLRQIEAEFVVKDLWLMSMVESPEQII